MSYIKKPYILKKKRKKKSKAESLNLVRDVHNTAVFRLQSMSALCCASLNICQLQCKSYSPAVYLAFSSEQQQHACIKTLHLFVTSWHRFHGETHVGCGPIQNANNLHLCELNPDKTPANMVPPRKRKQLSASL